MNEKYTITRTSNGWILEIPAEDSEGVEYVQTSVYEDNEQYEDDKASSCESLANLLWGGFGYYFQEKRRGGIVMEIKEHGREYYDEE